jgi:hypothetical protein
MKPQLRLFWLIVLLNFVSGCSGYRTACHSLSEVEAKGGEEFGGGCDLKLGEKVRINLVDGEQAEGIIQSITSREIILDAEGNNLQPRVFSADQVQSIEKPSGSSSSIVMAILNAGGILVAFAVGIANYGIF